MTWPEDEPADEELQQPRRRIPTAVFPVVAAAALGAGLLVAVSGGERRTPMPTPPPRPASSSASSTATPTPGPETTVLVVPAALLGAVTAAYPRAQLVESGFTIPVRDNSDRNYQFVVGGRRITVLVGPADARPAVETRGPRDVLVVAKPSGHRVAVSVRTFRGTLRHEDLVLARRLSRDARLLASP